MDRAQRLKVLESVRDWQGLAEELERGIGAEADAIAKAALHLRLGRLLEEKFLQAVKALKHFQDAYKLNPSLTEALSDARAIYWALGKTNMAQKLLDLELKAAPDGPIAAALLIELGDVLCDAGDYERAAATYAKALGASAGTSDDARACLEDVQLDASTWETHLLELLDAPPADSVTAARRYLRGARIARRFAPGEVAGLLARAYEADPTDKQAAALYEGLLVEEERTAAIEETQREVLARLAGRERAAAAFRYGVRWATRHQNVESGAKFLAESLDLDPSNEAAFSYLRELWGAKEGDWERVVALAESTAKGASASPFLLAQAGTILWRNVGDLMRARAWFERLATVAPEHPSLLAFEAQIGQALARSGAVGVETTPESSAQDDSDLAEEISELEVELEPAAPAEIVPEPPAPAPAASVPELAVAAVVASAPVVVEAPHVVEAPPASTPAPVSVKAAASPEKIEELRAKAAKQEQAKRYNEYVKTLVELGDALDDRDEKVATYLKAADLYTTKFSNAAEAVKAYEAILHIEPEHAASIEYLKQAYEKRRDWEKLIGLMNSLRALPTFVQCPAGLAPEIAKPDGGLRVLALEFLGFSGPEVREGLGSHLEKRKPNFPPESNL